MDTGCSSVDGVRNCLTKGDIRGLSALAAAAFLSLFAVLLLFAMIARNVIVYTKTLSKYQWKLIQGPLDVYVLSLFVCDALQAVGSTFHLRWITKGYVETGPYCSAQGAIQQIGETGVALSTLIISTHTFVTIWIRKGAHNRTVAYWVTAVEWLFLFVFVGVGAGVNGVTHYYTPTPYWCWIGDKFLGERIGGEYFWLWLTLFSSCIFYTLLALWNFSLITVDDVRWWRVSFHLKPYRSPGFSEYDVVPRKPKVPSFAIIAYPIAYCILILPASILRWIGFSGGYVPPVSIFAVGFIFGMSGVVDVLLMVLTRPNLLLFGRYRGASSDHPHHHNHHHTSHRVPVTTHDRASSPFPPSPRSSSLPSQSPWPKSDVSDMNVAIDTTELPSLKPAHINAPRMTRSSHPDHWRYSSGSEWTLPAMDGK